MRAYSGDGGEGFQEKGKYFKIGVSQVKGNSDCIPTAHHFFIPSGQAVFLALCEGHRNSQFSPIPSLTGSVSACGKDTGYKKEEKGQIVLRSGWDI